MEHKVIRIIKKWFYIFLDVSGIMLGIFLISLGWWVLSGRSVSREIGGLVLFLGISAFFIHVGHYYNLRLTRWLFGTRYFLGDNEAKEEDK